jgi:hypothetical protein
MERFVKAGGEASSSPHEAVQGKLHCPTIISSSIII